MCGRGGPVSRRPDNHRSALRRGPAGARADRPVRRWPGWSTAAGDPHPPRARHRVARVAQSLLEQSDRHGGNDTLRQVTRPTRRRWGGAVTGRLQQKGPSWTSMTFSKTQRSRPTLSSPTKDGRLGMPSLTNGAVRGWRKQSGRASWQPSGRPPVKQHGIMEG